MSEDVRVAVVGAGPSGIAAAKNCLQNGLDTVVFEQNENVGGNWLFSHQPGHSSIYENTHLISSRTLSQFDDFPLPAGTPDYPHHSLVQSYFESYARRFHVLPRVRFRHRVDAVTRNELGHWRVAFTDAGGNARMEVFTHLMVANGHHWNPRWPEYPGRFSGLLMHAHDFRRVDDSWRGKNVLVIGAGNSGCDVAVEAKRVAAKVALSMRGGQWFIPKYLFGVPTDVLGAHGLWLPFRIRQRLYKWLLLLLQGRYRSLGLRESPHLPLRQHPTLNSEIIDDFRHGRVKPRPAVERLDGDAIVFIDGRREAFDIIVACTGYWITFPFFAADFIDFSRADRLPLWRLMMHAEYRNLYFIGLLQPQGSVWPLSDLQARLACAEIVGRYRRPADLPAAIEREIASIRPRYAGGLRHAAEVDYHRYRRDMLADLRKAGIAIGGARAHRRAPPPAWPIPDTAGALHGEENSPSNPSQ